MNFNIFFTSKCNLQCTYCYETNKSFLSISFETLDQVIDFILQKVEKIEDDRRVYITTHGGEPLIEFEKIKYFIEELNSKTDKIIYRMTTNATLLNDEIIEFITKYYTDISISIDGTKESHNSSRVFMDNTGSYDIVKNNAKNLLDKFPEANARMTVTPDNVKYLYDGVLNLIAVGFKNIIPVPDIYTDKWSEETEGLLEKQGYLLIDYLSESKDEISIGLIDDALVKTQNSHCNGGTTSFTINTEGEIYPCLIVNDIKEFKLGDVYIGVTEKCVNNIMEKSDLNIESCIGCDRYNYCTTTRCRLINKVIGDDFYKAVPTICLMENVKVRLSEYFVQKINLRV